MYKKYKKTQKKIQTALVVLLVSVMGFSATNAFAFQEKQSVENFKQYKGEVIDQDSKKALIFATLAVEGTNISTITNTEGDFILKIPESVDDGTVIVSFLGYESKNILLSDLSPDKNKIELSVSVTQLSEVNINAPKDATTLVRQALARKGDNYFDDPTLMTAFYRETIKKRRKNVSLSEAVVNIYKTPYNSLRRDAVELYKARKSTDYSKLDTVALKLQGGPFNALYVDIMKYPEYIFAEGSIDDYKFAFSRSTRIKDRLIYVIKFDQKQSIDIPLYKGELFIDVENKTLTSAVYTLNIISKEKAARLFVRKKPANLDVWPTDVGYRVDYREKNGKWYYGYSNVLLTFKVDWKDKLFNSVYTMTAEMAVTDWEKNLTGELPKSKERLKKSIILSDEAIGFSDPDFWGQYNIIEPEKSIESAIKKIQRQLRRSKSNGSASKP
ncbi:carboxypeptidase-like regulatory domain-containing protein [Flagellimonas eckloniae]